MPYKRLLMIFFSLVSYILISIGIHFGYHLPETYLGFLFGIILFVIAIPLHIFGNKNTLFYAFSILLTSFGVGLILTSYYSTVENQLKLVDYVVAITISITTLTIFSFITSFTVIKKYSKIILIFTIPILFIITLIVWLNSDIFTGLTFYFFNIIYFHMICVVTASEDIKDLLREMSFSMFGSFILISIIVIIILSEGEALEGIGNSIDIPISRKKKRK